MNNYTVKNGDTLASIAAKSGMSIAELKKANPGVEDSTALDAGANIVIPFNSSEIPDEYSMDYFEKSSPYDDDDLEKLYQFNEPKNISEAETPEKAKGKNSGFSFFGLFK